MEMDFGMSMQQAQKLIMTQQLRLAIEILQLPSLELNEYIQGQLIENPVLEAINYDTSSQEQAIDWKSIMKDFYGDDWEGRYREDDDNVSPLNFIASTTTLKDYLLFQLHLAVRNSRDMDIGEFLIENIDSAGYLRVDTLDASEYLHIEYDKIENMVKVIQDFDPPGVGARNLKECLQIQLLQMGIQNNLVNKMVDSYLNEVGGNKYGVIARELSVTPAEAQAAGDIIRNLEPKPGRGFAGCDEISYIVPDVIVEKTRDIYTVIVNNRVTPRLSINSYYRGILQDGSKGRETVEYVKGKLDSAAWLIKSIDQRNETLHNVVSSIMSFQEEFLDKGIGSLRPLTLKDVAENLGVHESTVSRAINGKYVQTPRGLYQLKFFFTRGFETSGDNISSESIKKMLREVIEGEDIRKPLSDQKIANIMNGKGINISRRTVAKYREEMGIPSTSKRKRY